MIANESLVKLSAKRVALCLLAIMSGGGFYLITTGSESPYDAFTQLVWALVALAFAVGVLIARACRNQTSKG